MLRLALNLHVDGFSNGGILPRWHISFHFWGGTMNRIPSSDDNAGATPVSLAGYLLVAAPGQSHKLFERSVFLILEHSLERAVGIVLNKPLSVNLASVFAHAMPGLAAEKANAPLHFGGPESGPILAVHDVEELAEGGNKLGVYLSAELTHLRKLAEADTQRLRIFAGISLWGPRQLEQQVIDGIWHVLPAVPEIVFDDESVMWIKAMRTITNQILAETTGVDLHNYSCQWN
jgi:putative transcriptional regulator